MAKIDFNKPYNREDFDQFLNDFLINFRSDIEEYNPNEKFGIKFEQISKVTKVGFDDRLDNLPVYEIEHSSEHDARVTLTRESFKLMRRLGHNNALCIFVNPQTNNYRFSLIQIDFDINEKGKIERQYSNPRRFSFYLGADAKIHTPNSYLIKKGGIKDIPDLESRFSIEVVNKEFYKKIAKLFIKLVGEKYENQIEEKRSEGYLSLPSNSNYEIRQEFGVRLLGRIIFVWFLVKKSIISDKLFEKGLIKEGNYYHAILEPLFFLTLNTENNRIINKLNLDDDIKDMLESIPFLNGGLFEPHINDYYEFDEYSYKSKYEYTLKIDDKWFNELFKLFNTYNFTIDENSSADIELSIDPEMLGRIFENLLAEINPETGESARKKSGSYYTPRIIVDYMINQSLRKYLSINTDLDDKKILKLLDFENEEIKFELDNENKVELIRVLGKLKIIDPACGSGAFPIGILQKIVLILEKIDDGSVLWLDQQLSSIPDVGLRKETKKYLSQKSPNYLRKKGILNHCIFGVDVQEIAVEMTKLRCFLTLIVDEKIQRNKHNMGIEPLPNLEFKFICANTLIELEDQGIDYSGVDDIENDYKKLQLLREEYFITSNIEKIKLKKQYLDTRNKLFKKIIESEANKDYIKTKYLQISNWNPFDKCKSEWFDATWMFGIDNFDIVIANPPYGNLIKDQLNETQQRQIKKYYHYATMNEISSIFIEKSDALLGNNGIITFIITYAITFRKDFSDIRKLLFNNYSDIKIITLDRDRCDVFDSMTQSVSILIVEEKNSTIKNGFKTSKFYRTFPNVNEIEYSDANKLLLTNKGISDNYDLKHRLPKVGSMNSKNLLEKLNQYDRNIKDIIHPNGAKLWYRSSGNYWYNAFDRNPYNSSEIKEIHISKDYKGIFLLLLNSSLFYWWCRIYGDGRHLNTDILGAFPIPEYSLEENEEVKSLSYELMEQLFCVFDKKGKRFNTSHIKNTIDKVDKFLGRRIYSLTNDQINFITNYDAVIRNSHIGGK